MGRLLCCATRRYLCREALCPNFLIQAYGRISVQVFLALTESDRSRASARNVCVDATHRFEGGECLTDNVHLVVNIAADADYGVSFVLEHFSLTMTGDGVQGRPKGRAHALSDLS